jgi:hypothetical protein
VRYNADMKTDRISPQKLRSALRYEPESGRFFWLSSPARSVPAGNEAARSVDARGYRYLTMDSTRVYAQRAAWMIVEGVVPEFKISFRDEDPSNCRWSNLAMNRGIKGHDHHTPEGRSAYGKAWRAANPDKAKERDLLKDFGITLAEYSAKHLAQNGVCAICEKAETETRSGKLRALAVDHDHKTNEVRDLLCTACNKLIGLANEDRGVLIAAVRYLDKHAGRKSAVALSTVKESA